jgi:hypothetical protein
MRRLILAVLALSISCAAATTTFRINTPSTAAGPTYVSGSFTPAANELLVALVNATSTQAAATMTDSQSLGFTRIDQASWQTNASTGYIFIANALASASSMTVTFDCGACASTGANITVVGVSGMTATGAAASVQTAKQVNQTAGGTPTVVFASSVQTGNPTLGIVSNNSNSSGITQPTGWTELSDTGFITPTTGQEIIARDSGFTGTTITWGSTSPSQFSALAIELSAPAGGGGTPVRHRVNSY